MSMIRKLTKEELKVWSKNRDEQRDKLLKTFGNSAKGEDIKTTLRDHCIKQNISQSE